MEVNSAQQKICNRCGGFARCYSIRSPCTGKIIYICFRCATKHVILKDYFDVI